MKPTIIGIAGGTGSGKTTVVKKIVESLPPDHVAVVPLDSYYNDTTGLTDEERKAINFDHPDAFDWKLLIKQVHELANGNAIEQPTYSYILSNRLPETIHVEPKPVIIIEGIMTLLNKRLRDMMDLKIFVASRPAVSTPRHCGKAVSMASRSALSTTSKSLSDAVPLVRLIRKQVSKMAMPLSERNAFKSSRR